MSNNYSLYIDLSSYLIMSLLQLLTLISALIYRQHDQKSQTAQRYLNGSGWLLGLWVMLIALDLLSMRSNVVAVMLPVVERLVNVVSVILVVWVFITADRQDDGAVARLVLFGGLVVTLLLFIFTILQRAQTDTFTSLNQTGWSLIWIILSIGVGCMGFVFVFRERKSLNCLIWKMATIGLFTILQAMKLIEYFLGAPTGEFDLHGRVGIWAMMFCVPLTLYIKIIHAYERAIKEARTHRKVVPQNSTPSIATLRTVRYPTDTELLDFDADLANLGETAEITMRDVPLDRVLNDSSSTQLLKTLGLILEDTDFDKIPSQIVVACTEVLRADLAILLSFTQGNHVDVVSAHDGARNKPMLTIPSINLGELPTLEASIRLKEQRVIRLENQPKEIEELYSRLEMSEYGIAYFQPLMRSSQVLGIIIIAQPYSKRELSLNERELLRNIGKVVGHLLGLVNEAKRTRDALEQRFAQRLIGDHATDIAEFTETDAKIQYSEIQGTIEVARNKNKHLQDQIDDLANELEKLRARLMTLIGGKQDMSLIERFSVAYHEQSRLRAERDNLMKHIQELEQQLSFQKDRNTLGGAVTTQASILEQLGHEGHHLNLRLNSLREQLAELHNVGQAGNGSSESFNEIILSIGFSNQQIESENHDLQKHLTAIEDQLNKIVADAVSEKLITASKNTAEQAITPHTTEPLELEQGTMLGDNRRLETRNQKQNQLETQLELMEAEIRHLAADREAIARQRDQYRIERTQLAAKIDRIKEQRARLLADLSSVQSELDEYKIQLIEANRHIKTISDDNTNLTTDLDKTRIELVTTALERDKLMVQIEGDLATSPKSIEGGVDDLHAMLTGLSAQKSNLERELNEMRLKLATVSMNQVELDSTSTNGAASYEFVKVGHATDSNLIYQMVQELRTPMTSIVHYLDLLSRQGDLASPQNHRRFVDRISANVVRLDTMLVDLSYLSALDAGQITLEYEKVNMVEVVEDLISKASYQFHEKELTLNLSLEDNLPLVDIDVSGVQQVVGQLLNNAYIVSPPQSAVSLVVERLNFSINDVRQTEAILIAVEDSGGGIDADEDEVFSRNRFSQKVVIKGLGDTGIGLPIAKAIIEAHGGHMWLITHEGIGTRFNVALPINRVKFD